MRKARESSRLGAGHRTGRTAAAVQLRLQPLGESLRLGFTLVTGGLTWAFPTTQPDGLQVSTSSAPSRRPAQCGRRAAASKWAWVPIRSLGPRHRDRIAAHLPALDESDRYLRFGYPATDAQIAKYVDMLDFEHDEVFGIFNRRLELIAMAHLAHPRCAGRVATRGAMAEFGVSVLAQGARPRLRRAPVRARGAACPQPRRADARSSTR